MRGMTAGATVLLLSLGYAEGPGIAQHCARLQAELDRHGIALKLVVGADVHLVPGLLDGLKSGRIPTLHGSRYLLLEPSHTTPPPRFAWPAWGAALCSADPTAAPVGAASQRPMPT